MERFRGGDQKHRVVCKKREKIEKVTSSPNDKKGPSSAAYPTQAKVRLEWGTQPSLPVEQAGHCSLNLPQASRLLGMTKGRVTLP